MDEKDKRMMRITHIIDQDAAAARDFEVKVELTGVEVLLLSSMAKFGCMMLQASVSKDHRQEFLDLGTAYLRSIAKEMDRAGNPSGVVAVHRMCMAVIHQEHVNQWSFPLDPEFFTPEMRKDLEDMG